MNFDGLITGLFLSFGGLLFFPLIDSNKISFSKILLSVILAIYFWQYLELKESDSVIFLWAFAVGIISTFPVNLLFEIVDIFMELAEFSRKKIKCCEIYRLCTESTVR